MMLQNYFTLKNIDKSKKYVLGMSGGPDSVFLFFHLLKEIGSENFVVAHVNYNLRSESQSAKELVLSYAKENKVKCFSKDVEKPEGKNIESWARKIRYDFFSEVLKETKSDAVLIAHNWNDDMETFIFQDERDAVVSYFGLREISILNGMAIVRPMLEIKSDEIRSWISFNKIEVDFDKTNSDEKFARNRIRNNFESYDLDRLIRMKESRNRMMGWVYDKISPMLKSEFLIEDFLPLNDKEEVVFVYEYIKRFVPNFDIANMKKNITGEIVKELRSEKSFVQIKINKDYSIVKGRNQVFIFKNDSFKITKKITSIEDLTNLHFKNKNEILELLKTHNEIFVSNDWLNYQASLLFRNKKLKKYFGDRKISYRWKLENAVIYVDGEKNILNKSI